MKKTHHLSTVYTFIWALGLSATANASLVGDTIEIDGFGSPITTTVVDPGAEWVVDQGGWVETIDVFGDSFTINIDAIEDISAGHSIFLTKLDWTEDPLNATITGVTQTGGETVSSISFSDSLGIDSGSIHIDLGGINVPTGESRLLTFDIQTSHTVVPIPAAVWLFGSGLLGLIGIARRKQA